jgi:hypothetical protein
MSKRPSRAAQRLFPKKHLASIEEIIRRYGVDAEEAAIMVERQKVYGDPKQNHEGIAQGWAGILQPWAERIARGEPIPPHVVALMMAAMKLNRMRNVFHKDNYDDLRNYLAFAEAWQREWEKEPTTRIEVPASLAEQSRPQPKSSPERVLSGQVREPAA